MRRIVDTILDRAFTPEQGLVEGEGPNKETVFRPGRVRYIDKKGEAHTVIFEQREGENGPYARVGYESVLCSQYNQGRPEAGLFSSIAVYSIPEDDREQVKNLLRPLVRGNANFLE